MIVQQQVSFHDARPTVHYSDGTLWLKCEADNISAVFFLAHGPRSGAAQAREIAAALISCAEEAERTFNESLVEA